MKLQGHFFLKIAGHFLKIKRHSVAYCKILGGTWPQCPVLFPLFFICIYSIKNLQDELPITIPTNYSTKHYKDDNTTGSNRL